MTAQCAAIQKMLYAKKKPRYATGLFDRAGQQFQCRIRFNVNRAGTLCGRHFAVPRCKESACDDIVALDGPALLSKDPVLLAVLDAVDALLSGWPFFFSVALCWRVAFSCFISQSI